MREPREVAETLNEFFSNIVGTDKTTERMKDFAHFPNDSASGQITLNHTCPKEEKEIMRNMKTNKAIDHDLIPARAEKDSTQVLCEPYCTLFNYILDVGKIPKQWRRGEITPVYKKDCNLSKDNYRPITILPSLSKVFETLIHSRFSPRFRNILHKFVFAFRKHHGCDTALLRLTEEWRKELDDRKIIGLVSMDLSKAFDSLPHDLIVKKFKEYGADERTANIIENYFSDLQQRYDDNGLKRYNSNYQAIVMGKSDATLAFKCENSSIPVTKESEMSGITIDNKLKSDNHVAKICRKVS
ncbi:RNA-directed DNA polymerase from mobile element jockey [Stylophora pistillata]|uniref:RNA-directed DNA polymerase from mobile element jockey n=1 Tax=Stylophora pistillata TaxID=50429 RepID=A0A2B4RRE0_STYPI|nr:RNA-directed DNA polymerase from mobile element jockey [Stylophora pistillata]